MLTPRPIPANLYAAMTPAARNRTLALGALWGLLLAALPAFTMADPSRPDAFLAAALACAVVGGCVGALFAGRRSLAGKGRGGVVGGLGAGLWFGLVGGGVAAAGLWALMAVGISGFYPGGPVDAAALTSPRVLLGGFFVALSAFVYALLGGIVLGPVFGWLVVRAASGGGAVRTAGKGKVA